MDTTLPAGHGGRASPVRPRVEMAEASHRGPHRQRLRPRPGGPADRSRDMRYTAGHGGRLRRRASRSPSACCARNAASASTTRRPWPWCCASMGIPSRVVTGYLPGRAPGGTWVVRAGCLPQLGRGLLPGPRLGPLRPHARDEFGQAADRLREMARRSRPARTRRRSRRPRLPTDEPFEPDPTPEPSRPAGPTGGGPDDTASALLIGGAASPLRWCLAVIGLLFVRLRRLPEADGGLAYRGIVSLATRLGYGPHPSQTEYEYAGTLSETMPSVRRGPLPGRRRARRVGLRAAPDRAGAAERAAPGVCAHPDRTAATLAAAAPLTSTPGSAGLSGGSGPRCARRGCGRAAGRRRSRGRAR